MNRTVKIKATKEDQYLGSISSHEKVNQVQDALFDAVRNLGFATADIKIK